MITNSKSCVSRFYDIKKFQLIFYNNNLAFVFIILVNLYHFFCIQRIQIFKKNQSLYLRKNKEKIMDDRFKYLGDHLPLILTVFLLL
jgi:hypothetical protein